MSHPAAHPPQNSPAPVPTVVPLTGRLTSLDAYRGFIMLYMACHGFGLTRVVPASPDSFWPAITWWFEHATWAGGSTWDLIQPAFMFMVGVAVPFSYAQRAAKGDSPGRQFSHALVRALVLILISVFLASGSGAGRTTKWEFTNVLAQIGLGYPFLLLVLNRRITVQAAVTAGILIGYWALFAAYPLPSPTNNYAALGVTPADLTGGAVYPGFFGHWSKNTHIAAAFDVWFLNLFPRATPFTFNAGGYATLNFIPSLATMILGLMCGELLRRPSTPQAKVKTLLIAALLLTTAGLLLGITICPIIKRIWTPSWALCSGGLVIALLAAFYWLIDVRSHRQWSQFLVVVGMNSIAIYLMSQLLRPWMGDLLKTHLGPSLFTGPYGSIPRECLTLLVFWLVCWGMHRRKIFLRI